MLRLPTGDEVKDIIDHYFKRKTEHEQAVAIIQAQGMVAGAMASAPHNEAALKDLIRKMKEMYLKDDDDGNG